MKKKSIYVLLLAIALLLAGCGGSKASDTAKQEDIDLDLTVLSSTMVYSEVYNMMYTPDDYIGKTVKMTGLMAEYYDQSTDTHYYSCIVSDAAACCSQGIEFELLGGQDYPEAGQQVTVVGVFDVYQEDIFQYCTLRDAQLIG